MGNDADAAAWAEYRYGAARGADLALMITLGTGIGGGIVLDGRLRRGSHGVAGEWGHMRVVPDGRLCACGNRGCWEQYASGTALGADRPRGRPHLPRGRRRLLERVDGDPDRLTGEDVARAAAEGDPLALELVTDVGQWLGQGIADLAAILDPEVVVIGGGVSMLGEMVLGARARAAGARAARPRLPARPAGGRRRSSARRPASSGPPTSCGSRRRRGLTGVPRARFPRS